MAEEKKVAVLPPNPPLQQRVGAPQNAPVVGGLVPGEDDQALKSKETIPGGLYVTSDGYYKNAHGKYVDRTGKEVDQDKPVKVKKGETPVQDHQAKLAQQAQGQATEDEG